jgi:fatty acid desaturase
MHCGLRDKVSDFRLNTRSITLDPITEFLYWHMNWHVEHHMFPGVPFYNLKKLHNYLKSDLPKPGTLLSAWSEMTYTWKKQQVEPDYMFDTPIPHKTVNSENPLISKKRLIENQLSNQDFHTELVEMVNN